MKVRFVVFSAIAMVAVFAQARGEDGIWPNAGGAVRFSIQTAPDPGRFCEMARITQPDNSVKIDWTCVEQSAGNFDFDNPDQWNAVALILKATRDGTTTPIK